MCRLHIPAVSVFRLLALALCVLALGGCVGQVANTPPPPVTPAQQSVRFGHIFVVVEENHNYSDVVANPSAPYLNGLINQYGLASNCFANAHPSIPNYFMLTTGQTLTLIDAETPQSFPVSADNIVRELIAAGKTWKSYAEDLPNVGYTGGDTQIRGAPQSAGVHDRCAEQRRVKTKSRAVHAIFRGPADRKSTRVFLHRPKPVQRRA